MMKRNLHQSTFEPFSNKQFKKKEDCGILKKCISKNCRARLRKLGRKIVTSNKRENSLLLSVKNMSSYFPILLPNYLVFKRYAIISSISKWKIYFLNCFPHIYDIFFIIICDRKWFPFYIHEFKWKNFFFSISLHLHNDELFSFIFI